MKSVVCSAGIAPPALTLGFVMFDIVSRNEWELKVQQAVHRASAGLAVQGLGLPTPRHFAAQTTTLADPQAFAATLGKPGATTGRFCAGPIPRGTLAPARTGEPSGQARAAALTCGPWTGSTAGQTRRASWGIVVEYRGVQTQVGTGFSDAERETIASQGTRNYIRSSSWADRRRQTAEPRFRAGL